jgi:Na+-translocating ferredoxin:NAD+ oxidoreductase RnfC subunit
MEKLGLLKYLKWHPNAIHDVRDKIERVRLYLNHAITPIVKASIPVVKAGDKVKRGQLVAKPMDGAIEDIKTLSVALHASLDGVVKEVTDTYIVLQKV